MLIINQQSETGLQPVQVTTPNCNIRRTGRVTIRRLRWVLPFVYCKRRFSDNSTGLQSQMYRSQRRLRGLNFVKVDFVTP